MPEPGWRKVEKRPRSKRRLVKKTYDDTPLYDNLILLAGIGVILAMIGLGTTMPLEKSLSIMLILVGLGMSLPFFVIPSHCLYVEEEYVPEEEAPTRGE